MRELLSKNGEYRNVSQDAYEVMRAHTNLDEFDKFLEGCKKEQKEGVDMCQAIREIMEEEREIGRRGISFRRTKELRIYTQLFLFFVNFYFSFT